MIAPSMVNAAAMTSAVWRSDRFSGFLLNAISWEAVLHHGRENGPFKCKTDVPTLNRMKREMIT